MQKTPLHLVYLLSAGILRIILLNHMCVDQEMYMVAVAKILAQQSVVIGIKKEVTINGKKN